MGKSFSKSEMVSSLSRVEQIFIRHEQLNNLMQNPKERLDNVKKDIRNYSSWGSVPKIKCKKNIYVIAIIISVIVGIFSFIKSNNSFAGTYVSTKDESYVLKVNHNKTFEFQSPKFSFDGTWYIEKGHKYEISLLPDTDEFYSGTVTRYPENDPWFSFYAANLKDHIATPSEYSKAFTLLNSFKSMAIIMLLAFVIERILVFKHNWKIDSYKKKAASLREQLPPLQDDLSSYRAELNNLAMEYRLNYADWYPSSYSYPEAAAYFRQLFVNNRVSTMSEAIDKFEEYLFRNEMLRMQYKQKELMSRQIALQKENYTKLSQQIASDGAMTRATVVAEAESIKHKITEEANFLNNNIAAESARINKNIKKYSPFS